MADACGLSFSEWMRCRLDGRQTVRNAKPKARGGGFRGLTSSELEQMDREAAEERQRLENENAATRAAQQREDKASRAAKAAGGVLPWLDSLTSQEREEWADLKEKLLASEQREKEAEAVWKTNFGITPAQLTAPKPLPRFLRPKEDEPRPFRETDGGLILD